MASRAEQGASTAGSKQAGLLSTVSRAALRGRTATLGAFNRSPNRSDSFSSSPKPPSTGGAGAGSGSGSGKTESRHHSLGSFSGISMTASSALRGLAAGVGVGGLGAGSGGGSGSTTNSEVGLGFGRAAREPQSIRKGYLLMLRDTGQSWSGDGGGSAGSEAGGGGGGSRAEEWSERFFYLSGHFLRYKKQSRNLTSVNLKQTDHVEFNLQSAVVETFEEAQQREGADGGEGGAGAGAATGPPLLRRKHAFRLVAPAPVEDALSSPMQPPNTSTSTSSLPASGGGGNGTGGSSSHRSSRSTTLPGDPTATAAAADGGGSRKGSCRTSAWSPDSCASGAAEGGVGKAARQQVWVLAATNAKERAMWIQSIREAISLGQEFLCRGDPGCEAGSLAAMATRMSQEIEVRDRHYRLRFYRSCFIGEDAVSWIQSECGPCSAEEALAVGNRMVAAGLIYHCTYGHSLENTRLFYKFADSVVAASSQGPMSHQAGGSKSGVKGGRFSGGSSGGAGSRPYSSSSDLAGILSGGGIGGGSHNHSSSDDYRRRSFRLAGVGGLDYLEGEGEIDGLDDSSVSVMSSNCSVDDSGSAVCRGESETAAEAGGGAEGRGDSGSPFPKRGSAAAAAAAAAAAGAASSGRHRPSVFREGSGDGVGEKKVTIRKMAREMEGLKLTCAEMERSQMRAEQQMQSFVTGLLGCLETSMDRALAAAAAALSLAALSLALQAFRLETLGKTMAMAATGTATAAAAAAAAAAGGEGEPVRFPVGETPWAQRLLQALVVLLVAVAVRSHANGREAVRRAIQATTKLCSSDVIPASGVGAGLGQGRGGGGGSRDGEEGDSGAAVPLLHASQVEGLARAALGMGNRGATEATALRKQPHSRPIELLASMASNREPLIPPQLADSLDPLSSSSSSRPLPDLKSDAMSRDRRVGAGADRRPLVSSASAGGGAGAIPEGGGAAVEKEEGGAAALAEGAGDAAGFGGDSRGRGGVFAERPELASLPLVKDWPHHPIFVRLSPDVDGQVRLDGHGPNSSIPVNSEDIAVPFETPLFKGRLLVRVAGLPGDGAADYFRGKKRLMQCAVQGQFKKELPFDRAYTGQAYQRPFTQLPAKWLIRSAFSLIRRLSPALREDVTGDRPYMVSPLAATAQALRAEAPGDEAAIVGDLDEETRLLGASFMDSRVPASARKKFFNSPRNLQAYSFKPGVVYTFDFYQHLYNAVTFELDLGFRKVKLADYLNHQPAQIMALDFETGEMLWNVEIWNAALLKIGNGN